MDIRRMIYTAGMLAGIGLGGAAVGILAATADLSGALSRGTGILLTVMIVYKFYEEIAKQHMADMNPAIRKFME